jgi:two-component system phosphate regulon sensor histidine kinase PhoR
MKRGQIYMIVALMGVALLGIIFLQVQQLRNVLEIQRNTFETSVRNALDQVVDELQRAEVKTRMVKVSRSLEVSDPLTPGRSLPPFEPTRLQLGRGELPTDGLFTRRIRIRDSLAIITEQEAIVSSTDTISWEGIETYVYVSEDGSDPNVFEARGNPKVVEILNQTISDLSNTQLTVPERIDSLQLDSLLARALAHNRIQQEYQYMVRSEQDRQVAFQTPNSRQRELEASPFKTKLFPYLGHNSQTFLFLTFPDQPLYLFQSVWVQALISLVFSALIFVGFWFSIQTIIRQKRLSEMKNDFINNMTHELKTPIATISLATDALNNPRIRSEATSIDRYTRIIKEENQRMNRQVERVLQAARFDRNEIVLKQEPVGHACPDPQSG